MTEFGNVALTEERDEREGGNVTLKLPALTTAMKLNEAALIQEVIETVPVKDVELIVSNLSEQYVHRLLIIIASALDSSRHFEYYLIWAQNLITLHGPKISNRKSTSHLLALEKSLVRKYEQISKM
ncbi:periodic tryptophan protein 2 -like protein [Asbolus verrucosus]|uniref:Periodic tryptophan protein 2-like protein n=1 Tax=Asbolus verrucosus TaxID=1661398 RepID=A0A482WD55_ASBVE|nr:periodic tryptophan protein 2 -like protein [Asbolus verrucosus]